VAGPAVWHYKPLMPVALQACRPTSLSPYKPVPLQILQACPPTSRCGTPSPRTRRRAAMGGPRGSLYMDPRARARPAVLLAPDGCGGAAVSAAGGGAGSAHGLRLSVRAAPARLCFDEEAAHAEDDGAGRDTEICRGCWCRWRTGCTAWTRPGSSSSSSSARIGTRPARAGGGTRCTCGGPRR
jgi:hypothetical protein